MSDATFVAKGDRIPHTPSSALTAGDVVVQVDLIGIATEDIAANALGSLAVEGIFELPKQAATAMPLGTIVYWDDADDEVQTTADTGTNKQLGKVTEAALAADTTVRVKLTP